MARQESDRDDLFAELAALRPRLELQVGQSTATVCAGRRESTGGWSLFLGPDRVYHFDGEGRLRRAFIEGFLYRSEGATLARLRRERTPSETTLLRHDLAPAELQILLDGMHAAIGAFVKEIETGQVRILRSTPPDDDALPRLAAALRLAIQADPPLASAIRA